MDDNKGFNPSINPERIEDLVDESDSVTCRRDSLEGLVCVFEPGGEKDSNHIRYIENVTIDSEGLDVDVEEGEKPGRIGLVVSR